MATSADQPEFTALRTWLNELAESGVLCMEPNGGPNWMSDRLFCSLPTDHEGQHIAYSEHNVTGHGKDVIWLGPWKDQRPYKGPETDRLQEEWERRYE